jgi:hypothetical protein
VTPFSYVNVVDGPSKARWVVPVLSGTGAFKGKKVALLSDEVLYYNGSLDITSFNYNSLTLSDLTLYYPQNVITTDIASKGDLIIAQSEEGLINSTDSGEVWSAAGVGLGEAVVNGLSIDDAGLVYAATDSGIYRSSDQGAGFTRVSDGIDGVRINARSLTVVSSDLLYAGAYLGGVLKSQDGGETWTPVNSTLARKMVAMEDLDTMIDHFETSTPGNPAKGIHQSNQEWFGPVPDMDSDPRISVLILDIDDNYYMQANDWGTFFDG